MADDYNVKDAAGSTIKIRAKEVIAGVFSNLVHLMTGGAEVDSGNPLPVAQTGAIPAGTNNIGDVDVLSLPALPAGTNSIGKVTPLVSGTDVGDANPLPVKGGLVVVSAEFTRPADTTAYAIGDVVGNSTSAATPLAISGCARVNGGSGYIVRAALIADQKSITPSIRVHVFNSAPTQSNDNAAHRALYADVSKRVGEFVLGPLVTPSDTANSTLSRAVDMNLRVPFVCGGSTTTLYFILETLTAFTPANAGKFTLQLAIDQN
jgi:hypothetical protein